MSSQGSHGTAIKLTQTTITFLTDILLRLCYLISNTNLLMPKTPSSGPEVVACAWYTPQLKQLRVLGVTLNDGLRNANTIVDKDLLYLEYLHSKIIYRRTMPSAKRKPMISL